MGLEPGAGPRAGVPRTHPATCAYLICGRAGRPRRTLCSPQVPARPVPSAPLSPLRPAPASGHHPRGRRSLGPMATASSPTLTNNGARPALRGGARGDGDVLGRTNSAAPQLLSPPPTPAPPQSWSRRIPARGTSGSAGATSRRALLANKTEADTGQRDLSVHHLTYNPGHHMVTFYRGDREA